eukprot:21844-Chlamydomonas_euryale.AAC.1
MRGAVCLAVSVSASQAWLANDRLGLLCMRFEKGSTPCERACVPCRCVPLHAIEVSGARRHALLVRDALVLRTAWCAGLPMRAPMQTCAQIP